MERVNLTSNEKVARAVTGIETDAKHFAMNDDQSLDNIMKTEAASKFNTAVDEYNKKFDKHQKLLDEYAQKMSESLNEIECKPLFDKIHVVPFKTNPFQKVTKEGGIIVDLGGATPTFESNETGEIAEEDAYIIVGNVVDVGPEVKWVKPGDAVMYIKPNEIDVPLYNTGLKCINERAIIAVVNSGLTERFNNINK